MNEVLLDLLRPDKTVSVEVYIHAWKDIRHELIRALDLVPEEEFKTPMPDGSWSAAEITEHLAHTQCRFARVIPLVLKDRLVPRNDSVMDSNYELIEDYFINQKNANNPVSVEAAHTYDKPKTLDLLKNAMALFAANITSVDHEVLWNKKLDHFLFGPINLIEYTWVLTMHENHHTYFLRKKYLN